jgi:hypothetical protein
MKRFVYICSICIGVSLAITIPTTTASAAVNPCGTAEQCGAVKGGCVGPQWYYMLQKTVRCCLPTQRDDRHYKIFDTSINVYRMLEPNEDRRCYARVKTVDTGVDCIPDEGCKDVKAEIPVEILVPSNP